MQETNELLKQILRVLSGAVAPATVQQEVQPREEKVRVRVVDAAMTPRDYINQFLDDHPACETRLRSDDDYGYRDLASEISLYFGMDFDHTTVYRAVKKRTL